MSAAVATSTKRKRIAPGKTLDLEIRPSELRRFLGHIETDENGCWRWKAGTDPEGYPFFKVQGRKVWATRYSFTAFKGAIVNGNQIDHQCFCRDCVNPLHLEQKTHEANAGRTRRSKGVVAKFSDDEHAPF